MLTATAFCMIAREAAISTTHRRRILVTGASGYLGSRLLARLERSAHPVGWTSSTGPALDNADALSHAIERLQPDHVIHAAGRIVGTEALLWHDNEFVTRTIAQA